MLQRLGVRGKLLAVLAVPVLVLLLTSFFVIQSAFVAFQNASNAAQLVNALEDAAVADSALDAERTAAFNFSDTITQGPASYQAAVDDLDLRLSNLEARVAESSDPASQQTLEQVYALLGAQGAVLDYERSLDIAPATEEGGWVVLPEPELALAVVDSYAAKIADFQALLDATPADIRIPMGAVAFGLSVEAAEAQELFLDSHEFLNALDDAIPRVDQAMVNLRASRDAIPNTDTNEAALNAFSGLLSEYEALREIRDGVKAGLEDPNTVNEEYSALLWDFANASPDVAVASADRDLVNLLTAYNLTSRAVESIRYEGVTIERLLRNGQFVGVEAERLRQLTARTDLVIDDAQVRVVGIPGVPEMPELGASASLDLNDNNNYITVRTAALTGLDSSLLGQQNVDWQQEVVQELEAFVPVRDAVWTQVNEQAASVRQANLVQTLVTGAVTLAALGLSIAIALSIARGIVNPLRRLTTTASAVRQELPRLVERVAMPGQSVDVSEVQIPVESRDEIGRLAEAFNSVNATTLTIASEQAALRGSISEMFVNVARRDQVLLNRQLASIDEMERTQDDPETLTRLFALDHLATRMRRNSESLLVLAGIDTGRRLRRPMPLSDVIRTASSEIELYERVLLELDADPSMLGHSALTAAHLFAELLENATVFSDPGSAVIVRTAERDGAVHVTITDSGIGMTSEELAEANARVASTAASEILGAQRLGLFVVGRIARRVGARVHLDSAEGQGTVATVVMPLSLFDPATVSGSNQGYEPATEPVFTAPISMAEDVPELLTEAGNNEEVFAPAAAAAADLGADSALSDSTQPNPLVARDDVVEPPVTDAGLPARRRRGGEAEGPRETKSILGLPAQASDAQLSVLKEEVSTGFTPVLAADEVSPESAQQRARMFRGFRPMRSADEVTVLDESALDLPASIQPSVSFDDVTTQSSLIVQGYDPITTSNATVTAEATAPEPFVVPALEDDYSAVDPAGVPTLAADEPSREAAFRAEVSPQDQVPAAPAAQVPAAPVSPLYPAKPQAPANAWHATTDPRLAQALAADQIMPPTPVAPLVAPQLPASQGFPPAPAPQQTQPTHVQSATDGFTFPAASPVPGPQWGQVAGDNGADAANIFPPVQGTVERSGFFGKLFARDGESQLPQAPQAPTGQVPFAPVNPAPAAQAFPAAPESFPAPVQSFAPVASPTPQYEAPPVSGVFHPGPVPETQVAYQAPEPTWATVTPEQHWASVQAVPVASETPSHGFAVWQPTADQAAPAAVSSEWGTVPQDAYAQAPAVMYSPDQLARPLGWEQAGESALQATAPDVEHVYRPVVEVAADSSIPQAEDVASAVFSELSSLVAERPKVEKTRAGLIKRTPVAPAPQEEPEPAALPDASRDADAVRSRFSAFYTSTRRNRSDVDNSGAGTGTPLAP